MKSSPHPRPAALALIAAALAGLAPAHAGRLEIEDARITPGGGAFAATGGRFAVEATVGLPAPAADTPPAPGRFAIESGTLSPIIVVPNPEAPELRITLLGGGRARLSWPADAGDFVLQGTTNPLGKGWQAVVSRPVPAGDEFEIIVSPSDPLRCYRLSR